jgi:hypothetical protein
MASGSRGFIVGALLGLLCLAPAQAALRSTGYGQQGPTGAQGDKGDAGTAGSTGPKGDPGAIGPAGPAGVSGSTGVAGQQGPQGPSGAVGATGPAGSPGLVSVTPSATTRALGTTFQPSATKATFVSYSVKTSVTNPLLAGTSTATVVLLSDAAATPTTERDRVEATSSVGLAVTIALTTSNTAQLSYVVPAGHWVKLVSTVTGTGSTAIVSQVEETLN